jgi:hemin uptake protein HemP
MAEHGMDPTSTDGTTPSGRAETQNGRGVTRIKSQDLFRNMNEVEIDHDGRIYRLRLTRFNKLVLTA